MDRPGASGPSGLALGPLPMVKLWLIWVEK